METLKEKLRIVWKYTKLIIFIWIGSSIIATVLYRFINPPITLLMIQRVFEQVKEGRDVKLTKEWKSLDEISPNLVLAIIASEDQKFLDHWGFDFNAIQGAYNNNNKENRTSMKGGSTITQQVAKNAFLWSNRSWVRKGFETYFTILIEILWDKKRIMEVYLNVIETGDGIYGVEASSQNYFDRTAIKVSKSQAALLAATLPNPRKYSAKKPSEYILKRKHWIMKNMANLGNLSL